jgi:uncharacterized protein (TIRG00374 family)
MKKSTLSVIGGLIVGLVLIITWVFTFNFDFLLNSLKTLNYNMVILAGLLYVTAYIVRSFRWNLLLRNQIKLSVKESWLISAAGNWINYLIPIRAGELIKAILIKRIKKTSAVSILPSIFIDKFFDTLGIFFVLLLIPFVTIKISRGLNILIILLILMFAVIFTILILAAKKKERTTNILQVLFFWLPQNLRSTINNLIRIFIDGLNIFEHHYSIILYSVLLTAVGVLLDGLYFFCIFKAFNSNVSFLIVLFGYTLINLSYVLPQPPAQLGSNEWMMIIVFSMGFGLTHNIASAIMVFAHVFTAVIISVLGIIGFSYAGIKSVKQIQKEL